MKFSDIFGSLLKRSDNKPATKQDLKRLEDKIDKIMTKDELIALLSGANTKQQEALTEIKAKIQEQSDRIDALVKQLESQEVDPAVVASAQKIADDAQALADIIPNEPPPTPTV